MLPVIRGRVEEVATAVVVEPVAVEVIPAVMARMAVLSGMSRVVVAAAETKGHIMNQAEWTRAMVA